MSHLQHIDDDQPPEAADAVVEEVDDVDADLRHQRQAQAEAGHAEHERGGQLPGAHLGRTDGDDGLDHRPPDGQLREGGGGVRETILTG